MHIPTTLERITLLYRHKLWSQRRLRSAVEAGRITAAQYREITGEPFEPENRAD